MAACARHFSGPDGWAVRCFLLWLLTTLFLLRVSGQALVMAGAAPFLPAAEAWYSGLIPYPLLLPIQCAILALLIKVNIDTCREHGYFSRLAPRTSRLLIGFSYLYAGVMIARYVLTMTFMPEMRWTGGLIPIAFHLVLAGYLYTLGDLHRREESTDD